MNDVSAEILGAELKNLRIAHGYTQVDVAVAVDITQPSYSDMENGKTKPSLGTLYRLAAYYCITVDDILKRCIDLDDELLFKSDASKDKNKEETINDNKDKDYSRYADQPEKLFSLAQEKFNINKYEDGLIILDKSPKTTLFPQ